jgi:hypothetical protein
MATAVKEARPRNREVGEVGKRRYEVVPNQAGGLTLEPPITPVSEMHRESGFTS